jgi:hypothetical protein
VAAAPRRRELTQHRWIRTQSDTSRYYTKPMTWNCFGVRISGLVALVCVAGCAGQELEAPFTLTAQPTPTVADPDVCGTPQDCAAHLRNLVKSPNRDWIGVPQSADGYSSGTRLFAYRALRKKLNCTELKLAVEDAKAAMSILEKASYERARALAGEVMGELAAEQSKRCHPAVTKVSQS